MPREENGQQLTADRRAKEREAHLKRQSDEADVGNTEYEGQYDDDPAELVPARAKSRTPIVDDGDEPRQQQAKSKASPSLIRRAQSLGLSAEEINSVSPEVLDERVWQLAERQRKEPETPAAKKRREFAFKLNKEARDGIPDALADNLETDISKMMTDAFGELADENEAVKKELGQMTKYLDRQSQETQTEKLEREFSQLADKYGQVIGKGKLGRISKQHLAVRNRVVRDAMELAKTEGGSFLDHVETALEQTYGMFVKGEQEPREQQRQAPRRQQATGYIDVDEDEAPKRRQPTADDSEGPWMEGGALRPTSRRGADLPKGRERALRSVQRQMREQGQDRDTDEMDGIPE